MFFTLKTLNLLISLSFHILTKNLKKVLFSLYFLFVLEIDTTWRLVTIERLKHTLPAPLYDAEGAIFQSWAICG